jgi:ABC-type uncharacterized transport system ATPase subunit
MIEVQGLTKRCGATTAVDGLSFTVRPGRVTGLARTHGIPDRRVAEVLAMVGVAEVAGPW